MNKKNKKSVDKNKRLCYTNPVVVKNRKKVSNNYALVAKSVDAQDLKSCGSNSVPVQVRPEAP